MLLAIHDTGVVCGISMRYLRQPVGARLLFGLLPTFLYTASSSHHFPVIIQITTLTIPEKKLFAADAPWSRLDRTKKCFQLVHD